MKKKVLALGLALVMCMPLSMTAFAESSTTSNNSGNQTQETQPEKETPKPVEDVVAATPAGGEVKSENVVLAVTAPDGTATTVTLETKVAEKQAEVKTVVASVAAVAAAPGASSEQVAATVENLLTSAATPQFTATVVALSQTKGSSMVVNDMGSVKTAAIAKDALGNTIASAGVVEHVNAGCLVMLMGVMEDGTIEYVEGVVDPVSGAVMGIFQGNPSIITVLVLA